MKYFLLAIQLFVAFMCMSQDGNQNDYIIYLKNGTSVIGHFMSKRDDGSIFLSRNGNSHLYNKDEILKSEKYPIAGTSPELSQASHYDTLYQKGLISKQDYDLLKPKIDSNAVRMAHYDSLYKAHQISKEDYDKLRSPILVRRDRELKINPETLMRRGKNEVGFGGALMAGSGLFFIGAGVSSTRTQPPVTISIAFVGTAMFCAALPLIIHGAVLKHRAKKLVAQ